MIDRQSLSDFALVVLLVLPLAALAGSQSFTHQKSAFPLGKTSTFDGVAGSGRISLIG